MNKIRYAVSGILLALLTAMFMILPNIYNDYKDSGNSQAEIVSVNLEHYEQEMTPEQTVRIIIDNLDNCIFRKAENEQKEINYIADCKEIIENVFGDAKDSRTAKSIFEIIDNSETKNITTNKFTAIDNDNIVVLNIIEVSFDNLDISYEENSKVMLHFYLYNSDKSNAQFDEGEYQYESDTDRAVFSYYNALGVSDIEILYSIDFEPYFFIEAGLNSRADEEVDYQSEQMIQN